MNTLNEILRAVSRVEGRMDQLCNIDERVSHLETWQAWLKGAWAVMIASVAYISRTMLGR